jgi:glycosyltransferase involved in cell wall biosynthesis
VYSPRGLNQEKVEVFQGVQYRRISTTFDNLVKAVVEGPTHRIRGFEIARRKRPFYASTLNQFTYILQVAKELQAMKYDVVHIHEESEFIDTIRALNPRLPIVLHMHCEWLTQLDNKMIENRLKKTDLIIGVSNYITDKIRQSFPSLAKRCQTLYNGVDLVTYRKDVEKDQKRSKNYQLLYVSRVTPEKGIHVLIDAFKKVVKHYPTAHLEIVGPMEVWGLDNVILLSDDVKVQNLASFYGKGTSGSFIDQLKNRLDSPEMFDKVTFNGKIPQDKKVKLYQSSDIFIQPSIFHEPFNMSILEAMACQLPVVGSRVGGIPEIIKDGETGILVEAGDSDSLASAIMELLSDEGLRMKMGVIGRKRVESLSWDDVVTNLLNLYNEIARAVTGI